MIEPPTLRAIGSTMESLGSLLEDGEPEVIEQPVEAETVEAVEEITEVEPEKVEENQEPEATTAPEVTEPEAKSVPIQALMAEREKRQALEKYKAEVEAEKAKEPAPDIFEDQAAYTKHFQEQIDNDRFNDRANQSEFHAQREFGKDELASKVEVFKELKASNPALEAQVLNAVSPYHEIVDIVNKQEKMDKMQNIDEFEATTRAEIEAKVRAEIKAEMDGKAKADKNLRDSIPTSLVDNPSQGTVQKPTWSGPSTLDQLLD